MRNDLRSQLNEAFYAPKPLKKREFLHKIRPREINMPQMLIQQAGYIRTPVWILALAIISFALIGSIMGLRKTEELIPVIIPFLAAVSVLETVRSRKYGMSELERVTRFSLSSVIFARMLVLGVAYLLILAIISPVMAHAFGTGTVLTAVKILIPYLITMSISLQVERSVWGSKLEYTSLAIAAIVAVSIQCLNSYEPMMMELIMGIIETWGVLIVVLLAAFTVFEQWKTINYVEEYA